MSERVSLQTGFTLPLFCRFSPDPGSSLAGVLTEQGKRTRGHSDRVLHWLPLGHVEQLDFRRPLMVGETTDPERAIVSLCSY